MLSKSVSLQVVCANSPVQLDTMMFGLQDKNKNILEGEQRQMAVCDSPLNLRLNKLIPASQTLLAYMHTGTSKNASST